MFCMVDGLILLVRRRPSTIRGVGRNFAHNLSTDCWLTMEPGDREVDVKSKMPNKSTRQRVVMYYVVIPDLVISDVVG